MTSETFAEYVGLTADAVAAIEIHRKSPNETKSEILIRALKGQQQPAPAKPKGPPVDYGEGITLFVGEHLYLYLSKANASSKPDATGELRPDGFYLEGKKLGPLGKRLFDPSMKAVQDKKNHRNDKGEIVSLSSMRQWHVLRDGKLSPLADLKDPALARRRTRSKIDISGLDLSSLNI